MAQTIALMPDFVQDDSFDIKIEHNPPIDISGAVFDLVLVANAGDPPAMHIQHTAGDNPKDDILNGIVYIPVTRDHTSLTPPGKYMVSLKRTMGTETVTIGRTGMPLAGGKVGYVTCYQTLLEIV